MAIWPIMLLVHADEPMIAAGTAEPFALLPNTSMARAPLDVLATTA
jgi:hypothetical protein